jgi:glycosyltransferase involved in cell wall biosynthesis
MLIDVSRLVGRFLKGRLPTGVDRVCQAYLAHYGSRARALVRIGRHNLVFNHRISMRIFNTLQGAPTRTKIQYANRIIRGIATGGLSRVSAGTVLLNPGHSGLESESYYRLIQSWKLAPLFVVHDLIPLTHPEYCRPGEGEKHRARIRQVWETARAVVTNSQATLDALTEFAARCGAKLPPCTAALLGPGKAAHKECGRIIEEPYFVVLGTIEPRKNHLLLLQVWRHLVERYGERAPRLVLIGQRGWECENVVDLLERCETLRGVVTELHACSDAELHSYLHHAQALLFPSFAEGYGMPVLEALAQGVPVIASSLPVFREFARDIPEYIDPLDGRRWLETIMDFARPESVLRARQLARLAEFEPPTWASHFDQVDRLLGSIAGREAGGWGSVDSLAYGGRAVPG